MSTTNNYFSLFGLPLVFDINASELRQQYRNLQIEFHPDTVAAGTTEQKRKAVEHSALLNDAYQTLTSPVERAKHLFLLTSGKAAKEHNLASDPVFLMLQIEAREQIEDFKASPPEEAVFEEFIEHYETALDTEIKAFTDCLSGNDHHGAEIQIAKIQLFTKLLSEAEDLEQAID